MIIWQHLMLLKCALKNRKLCFAYFTSLSVAGRDEGETKRRKSRGTREHEQNHVPCGHRLFSLRLFPRGDSCRAQPCESHSLWGS